MNSWQDYLSTDALLPAAGWLVAMVVGIHSLWSPNVKLSRLLAIVTYASITLGIFVWYDYHGAQVLRSNQETTRSIKTLLALSGVSTAEGVSQGLDRLITRNLKPQEIIPTQEEELAHAISIIKDLLPNPLYVTHLQYGTSDWVRIALPVQRALERNGLKSVIADQGTSSPSETGLMFSMPDPSNPPDFALRLRDVFGTAGIRGIRFVRLQPNVSSFGFTIFVGPTPLADK